MKITKKYLKELSEKKNKQTNLLIGIFIKYNYSFIISYYTKSKNAKDFQKSLYGVPSWSNNHKHTEFKDFLKQTFIKYKLQQDEIEDILKDILILNTQILSKSDIPIDIPKLETFWYKLLKQTGKYFYEHPTDLEENERKNIKHISKLVEILLQKYIPITDIFNIKKTPKIEYDFKESENSSPGVIQKQSQKISNNKSENTSTNSLKYISSEQFENEYYNPIDTKKDASSEDKHINIVIKKKGNKGKTVASEIEEYFFK